ncbi:MAG: pilin [Candidatus Buchananbacteria bacterium]
MKKKLFLNIFIFTILSLTLLTTATPAALGVTTNLIDSETQSKMNTQTQGFLEGSGLSTKMTLNILISSVVKIVLSLLGLIFFILIIYAGFLWMTAMGNQEKIDKAQSIIKAAVIGLVLVLSAYLITYFVIDNALRATQQNNAGLN